MNPFFLPSEYVENKSVPYFDDTPHQDQWQNEVYELAHSVAIKNGINSVLDYGCGSGYKLIKYFKPESFKVAGAEVGSTLEWLKQNFPNGQATWLDASKPLEGKYGMVICSDVIEHVENPYRLLLDILSAKPRIVVISTPDSNLCGTPLGPPRNKHHVREWTMDGFHALLSICMNVLEHRIINEEQCTQVAVCVPRF